jgi:hypothetical protein
MHFIVYQSAPDTHGFEAFLRLAECIDWPDVG